MKKVSKKFKRNYKRVIYITLYIVIISWMLVSGVQLWLDCAILDSNYSNTVEDINNGNVIEVSDVYSNGDFILSGNSDLLKSEDSIDSYVRLPNYCRYYYNKESKTFFAPLTRVETRNLIIKFMLLDLLSLIIMIILFVYNRNKGIWLKTAILISEIIYVFSTYLIYANALYVLYKVVKNVWMIPLVKLALLCIVLLIAYVVDARREMKSPIKLQRRS